VLGALDQIKAGWPGSKGQVTQPGVLPAARIRAPGLGEPVASELQNPSRALSARQRLHDAGSWATYPAHARRATA